MPFTHTKVSLRADDADTTLVRPTDWNANHAATVDDGLVGAPGLPFASEATSGWYRIGAGILGWAILGVERLRLSATELLVSGGLSTKGPNPSADAKAWGCLWDGVTNDSVNLQAAIDAQQAAGGGTVRLPIGTGLANVVMKPKVHLRGAGISVTVLKSVAAGGDVIKGLNFATLTGKVKTSGDYALGAYEYGLHDLTVDGNKATQSAGFGVRVWGRNPLFENVRIQNCKEDGLWTEFTDVDDFTDPAQVLEGHFSNLQITRNDGNGWTHRGPHDSVGVKATIWNNGGWAIRNELIAGGYAGGISLYLPNSFLNANSFYCSAPVASYGGLASASLTGVGFQLESTAGLSQIFGTTVSGHTTGIILKAQNCVIDTAIRLSVADALEIAGSAGWNTVRINGVSNGNGVKFTAATGPHQIIAHLQLSGAQTLYTGSYLSSADSLDMRGSGASNPSLLKFASATLQSSNGWSPVLPTANSVLRSESQEGLAFNASLTVDAALSDLKRVGALTNNITINAPTNPVAGRHLIFTFLQDGTGGRTVTWNAIFVHSWSDTGNTANKRSSIEFIYTGSTWEQVSAQRAWA